MPTKAMRPTARIEAATSAALAFAEAGDLIVITPTDVAGCWDQVTRFDAAARRMPALSPLLAAE